jgi:hypothetical protein
VPPKDPEPHNPPQANVPTITVEVNVDINPDGPSCFIQTPQTCTAYVNVTIAGGPAGVGSLRVSGIGTPSPQIASGWPGMSQGFTFKNVPVNPGGTITYTADYGAPGNVPLVHYIGTGSHKFLPRCILFIASWNGSVTTDSVCTHSGQSGSLEDGYNYAASYSVNGQYAVNPEDGSGKTARRTTADVNEGDPKIHWTNDTIPDGTHTEGDIPIYPPRSVTVDVQNGSVSNLKPDSLKRFGSDQHNVTENPHCSFDKTTDEQSSL